MTNGAIYNEDPTAIATASAPTKDRKPIRWAVLLMVMAVACWVGYELNWIRERHAFLTRPDVVCTKGYRIGITQPAVSWALVIFGEQGHSRVSIRIIDDARARQNGPSPARMDDDRLTPLERAELKRARELFPEAIAGIAFESTSSKATE